MARKITALGFSLLFVFCLWYYYFSRERDWRPVVDAVANSSIESVNISLFSPDGQPADSIQLDVDGPYRLDVTGTFIGSDSDDFVLIASQNLLFSVQIVGDNHAVWTNNPNKLEPVGENAFSFSRKFKLPPNIQNGSYVVSLSYNRNNVASKTIQVVK